MASGTKDITFIVPGQEQPAAAARSGVSARVRASVRVGTERSSGEPVRVTARPGDDVVVMSVANGPTLVLHPADARDLLLAQSTSASASAAAASGAPKRMTSTRSTTAPTSGDGASEVLVAPQLGWPGLEAAATRGSTFLPLVVAGATMAS